MRYDGDEDEDRIDQHEGERIELKEEPIQWRLLRAFENGYVEGLRRGASETRFDHS